MWSLPISVEIDGKEYAIRNKCDYRVVLDVISALNDEELEMEYRVECALFIFYEDLTGLKDVQTAIIEMMKIINLGKEETTEEPITKEDYLKMLELLRSPKFSKMLNRYSAKEKIIISLKNLEVKIFIESNYQ